MGFSFRRICEKCRKTFKTNKKNKYVCDKCDFEEMIQQQHESVIGLDFDGVIHNDSKGFYDGTIYGDLIDDTREALEYLSNKYTLIIYTCKAKPERPLVNGKTGTELITEWLKKHDLYKYIDSITHEKPRALFYIDDKAIKFENWKQIMTIL